MEALVEWLSIGDDPERGLPCTYAFVPTHMQGALENVLFR